MNNKKYIIFMITALLSWQIVQAQGKRSKYEFMRNLPVYADSLIASLDYPYAWENSGMTDFNEWKRMARQKVMDCMLAPPPHRATPSMTVLASEQRDGYKAMKIEIQLTSYYVVPALMLVPDGKGPFPTVNCLHDHGAHLYIGKEKMIRPIVGPDATAEDSLVAKDAQEWVDNLYGGQFMGDYLAKNGYVVFSADAPMWGERGQKEGPLREKYDMIAGNMMMYGIDLSAYMVYDDIYAMDFLAQCPMVDKDRMASVGFSMGAYRSWMVAALSDKVKASVSVCWMVTTDEQMSFNYKRTENGGFANCLPGLRRWMDYPHIASMACPRASLFINGTTDKLFPIKGAQKAFNIMHKAWDSQGAGDMLQTEFREMGHECNQDVQRRVLEFLQKRL